MQERAFSVLDRYIGKTITSTIMITLFTLVSLSGIIKFIDQLKKTGQGNYDAVGAGIYTMLSVPKDIYIFFPMTALIGILIGLGVLFQNNELLVMQASGFTRMQITFSVMKTTIPLVLLAMIVDEWIAPQGEKIAHNYRAQAIYGGSLLETHRGLWGKDGNNFIYIEHVNKNDELCGVNIYSFNKVRKLQSVLYAELAKFDLNKKIWRLSQVNESNLHDLKKINNLKKISDIWKTNLTPETLGIIALDPDALSIYGLYNYIKYLKSNGQDDRRYQLNMWKKIFHPLSVLVMMMMGLSFISVPLHGTLVGVRIIAGISFGFLFYVLDHIFGMLSIVCNIPPIIGVLLPSAIFFLISLRLLVKNS